MAQQAPADMQDRACGSRSKPMTATATTMVKAVWQSYFNNPEGQSKFLEQFQLTSDRTTLLLPLGSCTCSEHRPGLSLGCSCLSGAAEVATVAAADASAADSSRAPAAARCCLLQ